MKISKSKQELARIISENGGWRGGAEFAAQGGNHGHVGFASVAPVRNGKVWDMTRGFAGKFLADEILPNWHQTILSRDEYFHLYPALGELCGKVTEENRHEQVWTNPPSIEQRAADYRNAKDYADRKQQEADAAKADAEAKLAELVAAGKALGLVLSVAAPEHKKPAKPYTGRFYNDGTDEQNFQTLCDGCGRRYGLHYSDRCEPGSED